MHASWVSNLEPYLADLFLHPWLLWTQRVTKMWETEVSEGQKKAWIMSSFPPWGMWKCWSAHTICMYAGQNRYSESWQ